MYRRFQDDVSPPELVPLIDLLQVVRKNELGFLVLDDGIFPAPHWSLSLAHPVDVHRVQRRFARELI
eukprot:869719-Pyramimonas_sp.AAC.1